MAGILHPKSASDKNSGRNTNRTVGRRDFFKGATAGAAALVATRAGGNALVKGAAAGAAALVASSAGNAQAQGTRSYTLVPSEVSWDVGNGQLVKAYAYEGTVPGPTIRAREGEILQITVVNNLSVPTSVHWHGVHPIPNAMDGVPGVTQPLIPPGGSFVYTFPAPPAGTYVYHSHHDAWEQIPRGLYGLLVVEDPRSGIRAADIGGRSIGELTYDRELPLVLGEWPQSAWPYAGSSPMLINGKTLYGLGAVADPSMLNRLIFPMRRGERILFRVWNAGNEVHPMHTHGLHYVVVAADGMDLAVPVRRHNLAVDGGEQYDIIVQADSPGAWLFHCHNLAHVPRGMIAVNIVT